MASGSRPPVPGTAPYGCLGIFVGAILGGLVLAAVIAGNPDGLFDPSMWTAVVRVAVVALPLYGALVFAHRRARNPEMRAFLRMVLVTTPSMALAFFGLFFALVIVAGRGLGARG